MLASMMDWEGGDDDGYDRKFEYVVVTVAMQIIAPRVRELSMPRGRNR